MNEQVHQAVRKAYAGIAEGNKGCGCGSGKTDAECASSAVGYTDGDLSQAPSEANMGLGCGNPTAIAGLRPGETVLDLGSGAGLDCFLAAVQVGDTGRVIGVDMTPEMVDKARDLACSRKAGNVEFRLGEIEHLPVADRSVDVVISNCVVNLVPDKARVFQEAHRVLRPGGRLAVSDTALLKDLPDSIRQSLNAHVACIAGAIHVDQYRPIIEQAGFQDVRITIKASAGCITADTPDPIGRAVVREFGGEVPLNDLIASVYIEGTKP